MSQSCHPSLENEDALFLKLFVLLYADDTIMLAENERQLIAYWLCVLNKDVHTFAYMVYMIALNYFVEMNISHNG